MCRCREGGRGGFVHRSRRRQFDGHRQGLQFHPDQRRENAGLQGRGQGHQADAALHENERTKQPQRELVAEVRVVDAFRKQSSEHRQCPDAESPPDGRLPEFDLVALGVDDPTEFPVFGIIGLLEDVASLAAQRLEQGSQVCYAAVHHE